MIQHLFIENFAIIENTDIDFEDGLNIITGETGAGKSIVITAVSLALGARADSSFVRNGKSKAVIQLAADVDGEDYVLTREISAEGKNLCRMNGRIVTLGELAQMAHRIADIHGQYDNQRLLDPAQHIHLVDRFAGDKIGPVKAAFSDAYQGYKEARLALDETLRSEKENARKQDYYRFELSEIEAADLKPEEDQELSERIQVLQNSEKIFAGIETAYELLEESEHNVLSALGSARHALSQISSFSGSLSQASDTLTDAYYNVQDVTGSLAAIREDLRFSPGELDRAIERLDLIDSLKKKYGGSIDAVLALAEDVRGKLAQIENFDQIRTEQTAEVQQRLQVLKTCASALTEVRKASADRLAAAIEAELHDLNFQHAVLRIDVSPAPAISSDGADQVEIMISTNLGEPLKPLVRTASGGEISRIMLAIRNITGAFDQIPTMIFDEIDAGISGITASVVGRKLKQISKKHQIICITHLPQIAAAGDANYRIHKESDTSSTYTSVDRLTEDGVVDEIARLLGGSVITETTLASARELIIQSQQD